MAARRGSLCGEDREFGAGRAAFVCDACLGLEGRHVVETMRRFVPDGDVTGFLSQQYRVPTIDLRTYKPAVEAFGMLPLDLCER